MYTYLKINKHSWNNNLATFAKSEASATNKNLTKLPNPVQTKQTRSADPALHGMCIRLEYE